MTGISEILILVLLIACIFILPRMFKPATAAPPQKKTGFKSKKIGARIRAGIVLSVVYPAGAALYLQPWNNNVIFFLAWGIFPVLIAWGVAWIIAARKK